MASLIERDGDLAPTSRPTTQQSKGRLVLEVVDFELATKIVVVRIYEVQSLGYPAALGAPSLESTTQSAAVADRPQSSLDSEAASGTNAGVSDASATTITGFYVTAIDEVENEYALTVSWQKALYLFRVEHEALGHNVSDLQVSIDALAASVLAHLDIIGNRHRDIGKLTCREPLVRVPKRARVVPVRSSAAKKLGRPVLKRQDQRAARSIKNTAKTREAIESALAGCSASADGLCSSGDLDENGETLSPRTLKARKSSDYRLLNRLAVEDAKTIWKSKLESIDDDPSFRAMVLSSKALPEYEPVDMDAEYTSTLGTIKRAVPEKKTKHKELQQRRDRGREARLRIARATSSSAIHDLTTETTDAAAPDTPPLSPRAATFEEVDGLSGNLVKRLPSLGGSSRRSLLEQGSSSDSIRSAASLAPSPSRKSLALEPQLEPEQFLRRRSSTTERHVLKTDGVFSEILGMGVEITTERPSRRSSLLLLGSPRLDDTLRLEKLRLQASARQSLLERNADENNVRRRSSSRRTSSPRTQSITEASEVSDGLATSASTPAFVRVPELTSTAAEPSPPVPPIRLPTTPRVGKRDDDASRLPTTQRADEPLDVGTDSASASSFLTARRFVREGGDDAAATAYVPEALATAGSALTDGHATCRSAQHAATTHPGTFTGECASVTARRSDDAAAMDAMARSPRTRLRATTREQTIEISDDEHAVDTSPMSPHEQWKSAAGEDLNALGLVALETSEMAVPEATCLSFVASDLLAPTTARSERWADEPRAQILSTTPRASSALPPLDVARTNDPSNDDSLSVDAHPEGIDTAPKNVSDSITSPRSSGRRKSEQPSASVSDLRSVQVPDAADRVQSLSTSPRHAAVTVDVRLASAVNRISQSGSSDRLATDSTSDPTGSSMLGPSSSDPAELEHTRDGESDDRPRYEDEVEAVASKSTRPLARDSDDDTNSAHSESDETKDHRASNAVAAIGRLNESVRVYDCTTLTPLTESEHLDAAVSLPSAAVATAALNDDSTATASTTSTANKHSDALSTTSTSTLHDTETAAAGPTTRRASTRLALNQSPRRESAAAAKATLSKRSQEQRDPMTRRTSSVNAPTRKLSTRDNTVSFAGRDDRRRQIATTSASPTKATKQSHPHHHTATRAKRSVHASALPHTSPHYHKKWGRWLTGRLVVDTLSCLQLEELVLQSVPSDTHVVKLGLRYARWSGTSLAAIQLLEHASLQPNSEPWTHEYWHALGNAHLDIALRTRKYLSASKFHVAKSLQACTHAFAHIVSLADPLLLLQYALCLFWRSSTADLGKADDVLRELVTKFPSFCDKDRLNLIFLRFQTLARLHRYAEATECIDTVVQLHVAATTTAAIDPSDSTASSPSPFDVSDYMLMLMHYQQISGDYAVASTTLTAVLMRRGVTHDDALSDEQSFTLWHDLATKCFAHEAYALALEFYASALRFATDSRVLASIHYSRGLCFEAVGDSAKCVVEYKRARNVNRHVAPPVALTDVRARYDEQFSALLQKPIREVIDDVRVTLYDSAVTKLQRIFRHKYMTPRRVDDAMSSDSRVRTSRRQSSLLEQQPRASTAVGLAEGLSVQQEHMGAEQDDDDDDDDDDDVGDDDVVAEHMPHEQFVARQQAAEETIRQIRTDPQYDRPYVPAVSTQSSRASSARPATTATATAKKVKPMSSEALAYTSGLLNPDRERPELRRKHSMDTFNKLGYIGATMPCIAYWDKVLAVAPDLFESRMALNRCNACIRAALPHVTDAIAFCALAECCGHVSDALEQLHDPSYECEVAYVCTIIDVAKMLQQLRFDGTSASVTEHHIKMAAGSLPDAPVRFPSIASAVHAADSGTAAAGISSTSPSAGDTASASPRALKPSITTAPLSPTSLPSLRHSSSVSSELSRLGDVVNAHLHARKSAVHLHHHQHHHSVQEQRSDDSATTMLLASPLRRAAGVTLHALAGESVAVLRDFRRANSALLHAQQPFGTSSGGR